MPADPRLKDLLRPILPLVVAAVRAKVRTPVATFSDTPKKLGCVYLPLTGDARQMVIDAQKRIDPADLAGDGLGKEPHVTVRYGLHTNDPAEVATTMAPHGPATASLLPELRSFPGDDHDVLYVAVGYPRSGPSVATQNWRLESLPHTDTHPKYIPHATVAYLKPGTASKYVGDLDSNGTTERGDTVVYSAPDGQKHTIRIGQTSPSADFADAPPTDYARYFAADQHGRYPGDLHREFGLGVRQFADHTGLVRKQVRYKLNGQTHERFQWVKPPDAPAAPKQPAPTTAPTPTAPAAPEKQPGKLGAFASRLAQSPGGRVLIKMGGPAVRLALKVEHKLAVVQAKTQQVAAEAARQRGFSPEQADRLEKLLRLGDFLGGYAAAGVGGAVAGGVGAKVGAMMPTASVAYLMYSTARDPGATWRAAKAVMRRTLGLEKATATHADDTGIEGLAGLLADRLAAADDPDWYAAMVYAGLGLTGDLGRAIDAADGEEVPEEGKAFSNDVETFAGRPGLVQKKVQYTRGGKSYTRMQWVKPPQAAKEKPAKKAKPVAPPKPDPKAVKADAHARVKELLADETPGPDHAKELHTALSRLTVPEIQALKKERDVRGGKTKADHIAKLLAHVQAVRGKTPEPKKPATGQAGVIAEYQSATGRAKQALENALANANVIDPDKPKRKPKDVPPRDLAKALTSSWLELHRLGNKPDEMAPLERALAHAGAERIGEQGSTEPFDGTRHDPGKTAILKGTPVKVIRPGWQMKEPGGTLRLVPAAVEPVTSGKKKPIEPIPRKPEPVDLMQKDPSHPVARSIREDKRAAEIMSKARELIVYEREERAKFKSVEEAKDKAQKAAGRLKDAMDTAHPGWTEPGGPKNGPKRVEWRAKMAKWQELRKKYEDYNNDVLAPANWAYRDAHAAYEKVKREFRDRLVAAAKPENPGRVDHSYEPGDQPTHPLYVPIPKTPAVTQTFDGAVNFVTGLTNNLGTLPVLFGEAANGRAFALKSYDDRGRHIVTISRQPVGKADSHEARDALRVAVHELGHAIEFHKPGVEAAAREFLQYRTAGEPLVNFNQRFPDGNYGDHEEGRKDDFDRVFGLRNGYYVGKEYSSGCTEIISMGLEKLHEDPVTFIEKDPEYAQFLFRVLSM